MIASNELLKSWAKARKRTTIFWISCFDFCDSTFALMTGFSDIVNASHAGSALARPADRRAPGLTLSPCLVRIDGAVSSFKAARPHRRIISLAEVAELPDAHGSGPCTRKGVGVRVPSSAPLIFLSWRHKRKAPVGTSCHNCRLTTCSEPLKLTPTMDSIGAKSG